MKTTRKPLQGVINILDFNRHFYYAGCSAMILLLIVGLFFHWNFYLLLCGAAVILTGLFVPLLVSAYVYDISGYYEMNWLETVFSSKEKLNKVVNIHAGFDETSFELEKKLPHARLTVFDFYNPIHHTEKAIKRARKKSEIYPHTTSISTDHIPLKGSSQDALFLLSAAHEIRDFDEKVEFLEECKRVLKKNQPIILVEHLRDIPNSIAFHIGVNHFFSRKIWLKALTQAGFHHVEEKKFTPFMSIFKATI